VGACHNKVYKTVAIAASKIRTGKTKPKTECDSEGVPLAEAAGTIDPEEDNGADERVGFDDVG
jgi:hypothetical protein